ncbi:MAG: hypothetical protein QOD41_3898 [Cryptosporangiaceae bacterium]|nr:hypothetical protein [Cryptosporangiaceae bacterium]
MYVVRLTGTGSQLLVFDQVGAPAAGTQVPAGGVARDEALADAAIREMWEETGLQGLEVVGELGTEDRPHPLTGQPRRTTYPQVRGARPHHVTGGGVDRGMRFACRFEPLPLSTSLADSQDAFLGRIDNRWGPAAPGH